MPGTSTDPVTEPAVRVWPRFVHESVTDGDAVSVWPRFAHESVTASRLVRASAFITHGTARQGITARKIGPATREGIGEG